MSIIVKGMEMPEGCFGCELSFRWYNGTEIVLQCNVLQKLVSDDGLKDPDCPLIEVPPHGRLIDADALKAWFVEWYDLNADLEIIHFLEILSEEDSTPTVIPADKDGET